MTHGVLTERPSLEVNRVMTHRSPLSAHYRALVQRILAANLTAPANQTLETIGITGCARGAGVSTVAFNLAVAAARADIGPVLFVDADVTKQPDRRITADSPTWGLADALSSSADPMDCVVNLPVENLSFVAGHGCARHDELKFDPFKAAELLNEYKCQFKLVIVDIPAPTELNDSVYLAAHMDGVVLVVESELSDTRTALRTKQQLVDANANLLGAVLNKQQKHVPTWLDSLL
jgi:Mrp family chromosome partitioning ATPase